jgi:hypothetical protein
MNKTRTIAFSAFIVLIVSLMFFSVSCSLSGGKAGPQETILPGLYYTIFLL